MKNLVCLANKVEINKFRLQRLINQIQKVTLQLQHIIKKKCLSKLQKSSSFLITQLIETLTKLHIQTK